MTFRLASLLLAVCILAGMRTAFAADAPALASGADFFAWYEAELKPKPSGLFEKDGEVFFHYRAPMSESGMFREHKAAGKAMSAIERMVFGWLSTNLVQTSASASPDPFKHIPGDWFDRNAEAILAIRNIPSRIIQRGVDGNDYVLTMGIARSALEKEAAKGPFEKRPGAYERQWKSAVRNSLTTPGRMAFFRDCGALDLWTLLSEETSGTKAIEWSRGTEQDDCRAAIRSLRDSAAGAPPSSSSEWTSLLDVFPVRAAAETNSLPSLSTADRVRTMLLSFASCPLPSGAGTSPDLDRMVLLMDEPATNAAATDQLVVLVAEAPGAELPWCALGDRLLATGSPYLALSSYRNALRINHSGALALDGLRRSYSVLDKPALARGVAALILALAEDGSLRATAESTLKEGSK